MFFDVNWRPAATVGVMSAFVLVLACGGEGGVSSVADGGLGDGAPNPNRVSGTFSLTSIAETTIRKVPIDLSGVDIEAIMTNGERVGGSGDAGGNFEILDVPEGRYTLRIGERYIDTEVRRFDLAVAVLGREDVELVTEHTPINLSLTNLVPWSQADTVELFSPSGGFAFIDAVGGIGGEPTVGATSYSGLVDALLAQSRGEANSDDGDVLYVTQVGSRQSGTNEIREVLAGATVAEGVAIRNGSATTLEADLTAVANDRSLEINWDAPAYLDAMSATGPSAPTQISTTVRLVATPTDPRHGVFAAFPTLAAAAIDSAEVVSLSASFGSPFPSHWEELEIDELSAVVELDATSGSVVVRAGAVSLPGRLSAGATPLISAASNVTIGGLEATRPQTGVGETPVVSWTSPSVGATNGFEVDVVRISGEAKRLAVLFTTDSTISIPSGIIEADGSYYLVIRSRSAPSVDLALEPLAQTVPSAFAEFATAPFSP